jgi:hypothetical protein
VDDDSRGLSNTYSNSQIEMIHRDLQAILKGAAVVIMTAAFLNSFALVKARSMTMLVGEGLLLLVLSAFVVSIDFSLFEMKPLKLLPQTQLALWLVGIVAVILATNGLSFFVLDVPIWVFGVIALTVASRAGFVWLWDRLTKKSLSI